MFFMICVKCKKYITKYPCSHCGHDDTVQKDAVEGGARGR